LNNPPSAEGFLLIQSDRILIFANGVLANPQALRLLIQPGDALMAVDGGLYHLRRLGLEPDLVIGDLDSIALEEIQKLRESSVRVEQYPVHKDETDLELAVETAVREGYTHLMIVAALGGRLDMTLGNLFLLNLPVLAALDARLEDGDEEVFLIRSGDAGRAIDGQPGDIVSLLPLLGPAHGVLTADLSYPLRRETLYPERTRGISNVMTGVKAHVSLEAGLLVCIHTRQKPSGERPDERKE
jgi:thiamine pyrophosphokinase